MSVTEPATKLLDLPPRRVYLASPYSHPDIKIRTARFRMAARLAAALTKEGHIVYSPICHCHPISIHGNLPGNADYWLKLNESMFVWANHLVFYKLDGWYTSVGMNIEIRFALEKNLPITTIEPGWRKVRR